MYRVEDIIGEYREKIFRLALSISRNEKDAEDILQNTLIKILRNLKNFRSRSRISTWIYRIAYNESLMFLRAKRRKFNSSNAYAQYVKRLPPGLTLNWSKLPDQELLDKELKTRIEGALKDLPIQYRMPLLLHRVEGLPLIECARILEVTQGTVKARLHRAYSMVKDELDGYFKDRPELPRPRERGCGSWTGFIFDYAGGKVSSREQSLFTRHIKDCPRCNTFLHSYLQSIRITGALECKDVPAPLKEKIESFLTCLKK